MVHSVKPVSLQFLRNNKMCFIIHFDIWLLSYVTLYFFVRFIIKQIYLILLYVMRSILKYKYAIAIF